MNDKIIQTFSLNAQSQNLPNKSNKNSPKTPDSSQNKEKDKQSQVSNQKDKLMTSYYPDNLSSAQNEDNTVTKIQTEKSVQNSLCVNCPAQQYATKIPENFLQAQKKIKVRKILDDKYEIIQTIGEGRYAKVKLAVDLKTKKQVAVKIMRVKNMVNKKDCLECFFTEINILTECRHPNIVKILDASFDGLIVKEQLIENENNLNDLQNCNCQNMNKPIQNLKTPQSKSDQKQISKNLNSIRESNKQKSMQNKRNSNEDQSIYYDECEQYQEDCGNEKKSIKNIDENSWAKETNQILFNKQGELNYVQKLQKIEENQYQIIKRKSEICYYVMKLAEFGELYSFIEHTDRFDEAMTRYLLDQLIDGMKYLHTHGIVHRDIKPENLLINRKGKLIIADFSFAIRLKEIESDEFFLRKYDPMIEKRHDVGSEMYNAPEIWDNEINLQEFEQQMVAKSNSTNGIFNYAEIDSKLRSMSVYPQYNGEKADIFSIGATLFMMRMKSPPFKKAILSDPYFKRLCQQMKLNFWKIFKSIPHSNQFREIIEKTLNKFPGQRFTLDQIRQSKYFECNDDGEIYDQNKFIEQIKNRYQLVEIEKDKEYGKINHEHNSLYYSEGEADEEMILRDNKEFHETRINQKQKIEDISRLLRHQRNMKKIKKDCFKNMIAGPSLIEINSQQSNSLKIQKQHSYSFNKKDSGCYNVAYNKITHKNSLVLGPSYNSDTEDSKYQESHQKAKEEINREAKHWSQQFNRQSSQDQL